MEAPVTNATDPDWVPHTYHEWRQLRLHGACVGTDPDVFFPKQGSTEAAATGRQFCVNCPIRQQCLDFSVQNGEQTGIWGGATYRERMPLISARPRWRFCVDCRRPFWVTGNARICAPCRQLKAAV